MDRRIWERLQRFESRDYVTQEYKKRHGRSLNAKRAGEIVACFTQAKEYFSSASTASDTVKPLLIYYGIASFARGSTLFKNSRKNEESLTPSHGLVTVDWAKTLSGGIANVLNLQVSSCQGTFSEFVGSMGNSQPYEWLMPNGNVGGFWKDFGQVQFLSDATAFSLGDLLSRETELASEYEIANGEWGNTDIGQVQALPASVRVFFAHLEGRDLAAAVESYRFPKTATGAILPHPKYPIVKTFCVEIPAEGEDRKLFAPYAVDQGTNVGKLVRPFHNGDNLIDLHRAFIEAFILGMICRYFPSRWIALLRSEKGDIARSVMLSAVYRLEQKFPEMMQMHLSAG